jgi:ribonuclease HII
LHPEALSIVVFSDSLAPPSRTHDRTDLSPRTRASPPRRLADCRDRRGRKGADPKNIPKGLNDSKLLAPDVREALYEDIVARAIGVSVSFASAAEIDAINIRQATFAAMRRALAALAVLPSHVLIDGNDLPPCLVCKGETLVKGDAKSASIAAASIVAKVTRDRLMRRLCTVHPVYGFSRHAGYATRAHLAAIAEHGPSPYHRLTFAPFRLA